jgi:hypothetical protein
VKDLERLVRRFTSLNKNHEVPSSCHVEPYSGSHALPEVSVFIRVVFPICRLLLISLVCLFSYLLFSLYLAGPQNSLLYSPTT